MQKIKLISRRLAALTLHVLQFERPEGFSFKPGQFARLGLPAETEGADPVIRGYSIVHYRSEGRRALAPHLRAQSRRLGAP